MYPIYDNTIERTIYELVNKKEISNRYCNG